MSGKGGLILDFLDVYGDRPNDRVDVTLSHATLSDARTFRDKQTRNRLKITDLESTQGGLYKLLVHPMRHRPVSQCVKVLEDKTVQQSIVLPIDPDKIKSVEFPAFDALSDELKQVLQASAVEGFENKQGADLFNALDAVRKAGLLNVYAKMKATKFTNNRLTSSYVVSLTEIHGDRFFARVQKELRGEVKNSVASRLFHEVSEAMHTPPPGYEAVDSYKTLDHYGNLQCSFFCDPKTGDMISDTDIDDAQGIEHVFQVTRNFVTGATNPFDIHEILLASQKIDPGYRIVV